MATPDIRALIFDMDGVIANTDELHYQTWKRLADEEDVAFSREKYARMSGVGHHLNSATFTENMEVDEKTLTNWMQRKQAYYVELRESIQPSDVMPGIVNLIQEAHAAELPIAVASSSRNARPVLEKLGLDQEFVVIGDGYTVKNLKPAPDIFLWVAGALQISPMHCLILEDAAAGVDAALSAGAYVIGVGERPLEKAHAKLTSLADISLRDLMALI